MFSLNKPYHFLFFLGLFFFPFNSFDGVKALGEFKNESGAYFFLLGFLLLFFQKKISIPLYNSVFKIILVFLGWCFLSTLLNLENVENSYFKHTTGINRFIRQYVSLLLSSIVFFLFYYNVLIRMELKEILYKIRTVFLYSLFMASIVGFFEILAGYYGISLARYAFYVLDYFPFFEKKYIGDRISSIADEPPFFAVYLITISGWMFSYIITNKGILKYLPTLLILVLTFYSGSRTALIVIFVQVIIFLLTTVSKEKIIRNAIRTAVAFSFLTLCIFIFNGEKIINAFEEKIDSLDFKSNLTKNISNQSRFGMQYAAIQVFLENPIIGVGYGQQTYYSRFHYPAWAMRNNYEFEEAYKNPAVRAFPPSYNMYTRILSETGLIGISIFIFLIYFSIKRIRFLIKNKSDEKKVLAIILLVGLSGLFINLLQIDTFRLYGLWLYLAILIVLTNKQQNAYE